MLKSIRICFLIAATGFYSQAFASNWEPLISGTTKNLWDVFFIDAYNGFACGDSGTLLRTTDGFNWNTVNTGTSSPLIKIHFPTPSTGYVSGSGNATLLKTTDGGDTWTNISLNLPSTMGGGIWFTSADTGFFAIGDNQYSNSWILRTVNGGSSWDTVYSNLAYWISYIHFPNSMDGYATSSGGKVLKTADGGNTWTSTTTGTNSWMSGIYFFDGSYGLSGGGEFTSGNGTIFSTTNGGSAWSPIYTGPGGISKIWFADANNGFALASGNSGAAVLLHTYDGGVNWNEEFTPGDSLRGIHFPDPWVGYAVGNNGNIIKTYTSFSIYGNVWNQDMTSGISNGVVYLIEYDTAAVQLSYYDSVILSGGMNEYYFFEIPAGNYLILARPDEAMYPNAIPTYFGDTAFWGYAQVLNLLSDTFNIEIRVREIPTWTGTGFCSGTIRFGLGSGKTGNGNAVPFGDPVPGIDVALEQVPGGIIKAHTTTNDTGFYSFANIPMNTTYKLLVDIPGLPMDSSYSVTINTSDSIVTDLDFVVDTSSDGTGGIYVGYPLSAGNFINPGEVFRAFPNPSNGKFTIFCLQNSIQQVAIFNVHGEKIFVADAGRKSSVSVDLSAHPKGIYLIHLISDEGIRLGKIALE